MPDAPKSMPIFFMDNRHMFPQGAGLHGDLVITEDQRMYPNAVAVAVASVPWYDGCIVLQAGNMCLVATLIPGVKPGDQSRWSAVMRDKKSRPEAYRIDLTAIIQRLGIMRAGGASGNIRIETVLDCIARQGGLDAAILRAALDRLARSPTPLTVDDQEHQAQVVHTAAIEMMEMLTP